MSWRRTTRDDWSLAVLWSASAVAALALGPHVAALARLLPRCVLHALTGVPCPACGATRAAVALSRGQLLDAAALNPLAALGLVALLAGGLLAPLWVGVGGWVPRLVEPLPRWWRPAAWLTLAAHWGYLILVRR